MRWVNLIYIKIILFAYSAYGQKGGEIGDLILGKKDDLKELAWIEWIMKGFMVFLIWFLCPTVGAWVIYGSFKEFKDSQKGSPQREDAMKNFGIGIAIMSLGVILDQIIKAIRGA